jgi:hypothetical protein
MCRLKNKLKIVDFFVSQNGTYRHVEVNKRIDSKHIQKNIKIKYEIMKTPKLKLSTEVFTEFALSVEEMIFVRGGEGDPVNPPITPPVKV